MRSRGRRPPHPPRRDVELRRRGAPPAAAQTRTRPVAGAAALGAVAQLARRAHRPDAAGDRLRHARPGGTGLRPGTAVLLAADEPAIAHEGTRGLGRRVQPLDPRQEEVRLPARPAVRQPLALRRDDRKLRRLRHRPRPARAGGKNERAAGRRRGARRRRCAPRRKATTRRSTAARPSTTTSSCAASPTCGTGRATACAPASSRRSSIPRPGR
jgi:hypothetical protein